MTAQIFQPIAARPAPVKTDGLLVWIRTNLFSNLQTSIGTVLIALVLLYTLPPLLQWGLVNAVWAKDAEACHIAHGAC